MSSMSKLKELFYYPFVAKKYQIRNFYERIKTYHQRGLHGFSKNDAWGTNYYLVQILPKMLRQMAEANNSYPGIYPYDSAKKWKKALLIAADDIEAWDVFEEKPIQEGFGKDPAVLKQFQKDKIKAEERTKKGMKFVAKNFFDLWD
jgi:hypothetical protein